MTGYRLTVEMPLDMIATINAAITNQLKFAEQKREESRDLLTFDYWSKEISMLANAHNKMTEAFVSSEQIEM